MNIKVSTGKCWVDNGQFGVMFDIKHSYLTWNVAAYSFINRDGKNVKYYSPATPNHMGMIVMSACEDLALWARANGFPNANKDEIFFRGHIS